MSTLVASLELVINGAPISLEAGSSVAIWIPERKSLAAPLGQLFFCTRS